MADKNLPLLLICSYCKKVRFPAGASEGEWISMEVYGERGGPHATRATHGVCPSCYEKAIKSTP